MTSTPISSTITPLYDPCTFCSGPIWVRKIDSYLEGNGNLNKHYVIHMPSGDLYRDEPLAIIGLKCFLIFVSSPIVCGLRMSWYSLRLITDTAFIAIEAYKRAKTRNDLRPVSTLYPLLKYRLQENSFKACLAPCVCVLTQIASLSAVVSPYGARRLIGKIEAFYNGRVPYRQAYCFLDPTREPFQPIGCLSSKARLLIKEAFYHARCFQPIGHVQ